MKKLVILFVVIIVCLSFSACNSEETSSSKIASSGDEQISDEALPINTSSADQTLVKYFKQQLKKADSKDEEPQDIVKRLWYIVNVVYNVDDFSFSFDAEKPEGAPLWGSISKYVDFERLTENLFTQKGKEQLLNAHICGAAYIYYENGEYYHMGPWKTGYNYERAFKGYNAKNPTETRMELEVLYELTNMQGNGNKIQKTTMTIVKQGGQWLIDDYVFPEAKYPNK